MSRADTTRSAWLAVLDKYCENRDAAGSDKYWSPRLDTASRDEIRAIQNAKLAAADAVPLREQRVLSPPLRSPRLASDRHPHRRRSHRQMARRRQDRDGGGRAGAPALRHLHRHDRRGLGAARLDDVLVLRLDRRAARLPLQPRRSRDGRLGQRARAAGHGLPQGRHRVHGHRLRPACLGLGRAIRARENAASGHPRRRHGCARARRHRRSLQADHPPPHAVLCAASRRASWRAWASIRARAPCVRCSSPASRALSVPATRERIQELWGARMVEFYGCTEASPHVGGYSCDALAARHRAGVHASDRGHPDLGSGRCGHQSRVARRRARAHGLHLAQLRKSRRSCASWSATTPRSIARAAPAGARMRAPWARSPAAPTT